MKHSSNNQGPFTKNEYEDMLRESRRKRYIDVIMILESNGFKVTARQEAIDQENTQMVAILKARNFLVLDKKNVSEDDKINIRTLLTESVNEGDEGEKTQKQSEAQSETEEKGTAETQEEKT